MDRISANGHDLNVAELAQVIHDNAPEAVKTGEIKNHFGRKVAIVSHDS